MTYIMYKYQLLICITTILDDIKIHCGTNEDLSQYKTAPEVLGFILLHHFYLLKFSISFVVISHLLNAQW